MTQENVSGWDKFKNWFKVQEDNPVAIAINDFEFPAKAQVAGQELVLNGAGIRSIEDSEVYAVGLYLPQRTTRADTAKAMLGARRLRIYILANLVPEDFIPSLRKGIQLNTNETSREFIKLEQQEIEELMSRLGRLDSGDVVDVDWIPGTGTSIYVNNKLIRDKVRGKAIYDAILSIWLGNDALEDSLKESLLHP